MTIQAAHSFLVCRWLMDSSWLAGVLLINVKSYFNATWFLLLSVLYESRRQA